MGAASETASSDLVKSDEQGKGFAGRLNVSKRYAVKLADIADRLEPAARSMLEYLLKIDATVQMFVRIANEDPEQVPHLRELFQNIREMAEHAEGGFGAAAGLADTVRANSRFSKDLRGPSARIETALRQIADATAITRKWAAQVASFLPPAAE